MKKMLNVFISYSVKDVAVFNELLKHLSILEDRQEITLTHDQLIYAGENWEEAVNRYLHNADIILVLLSPDSLNNELLVRSMSIAEAQARNGIAKLIPILVRNCEWKSSPFASYYMLPSGGRPIDYYNHEKRGTVYQEIVKAVEDLIGTFREDWYEIIKTEFNDKTGTLNLSNYNLSAIPAQVFEMAWLHTLILTNNQIEDIGPLEKLSNIVSLDLSFNRIARLTGISNLPLTYLDLGSNQLTDIEPLVTLDKLTILYLHQNNIERIPDLSQLKQLSELDISNNRIREIEGLQNLSALTTLNLSGNMLKRMEGLPKAEGLTELKLMDNKITRIEGLEHFSKLKTLDLFKNQVTVIENLHANVHLQTLGLSINKITVLENIRHLADLEVLYAAHNNIEDVTELQNMQKLRRVILTNNKIFDLFPLKTFIEREVPVKAVYSFDSNEQGIFVKDNPIQYPPLEVLMQGNEAILRNFKQQEDALIEELEPYQSNEIKLILLGNANVGKTFLATYIKTHKKNLPANNASTHGMVNEFVLYEHPAFKRPIKMRLLDFGGQEYYHDTHHLFFTTDTIYLLLWEKDSNRFGVKTEQRYAVATGKTEEETNAVFPIAYWLDAVHYFLQKKEVEKQQGVVQPKPVAQSMVEIDADPVVILVETKRNKKGYTLFDTSPLLPFRNLVHSQAAISISRDDNKAIAAIGADSLFDSLNNLVGTMFEKKWSGYYGMVVDFFDNILLQENQELLKARKANKLVITLQEAIVLFNGIIKAKNKKYKFDNENAKDLCRFLANRGYVLYFDENKICLSPDALTTSIYQVLNESYNKVGMIAQKEAALHDPTIISIMEDFKLLVPHPAGQGFIAPQLLPESSSSQLNLFLDVFKPPMIRFSIFGYIHKNIIQELFHSFKDKLIADETQNYIWKNGFIIRLANELYKINISSAENARIIDIQYLSNFDGRTLQEISALIENVLAGRRYTKELSNDGKFFIPAELVIKNLQLAQFVYDSKLIRVADYKNFLDTAMKKYAMKKLFISYSSKNTAFMRRFVTHLEPLKRNGSIDFWHDRMIEPGTRWDDSIKKELALSDVVVFLLSPDFIATNYIFDVEIPQVLEQFSSDKSKIFFVELQACSWERTILKNYQQTTDPGADNKSVIIINEPLNDTSWRQVITELEKKL